MPPHRAIEVVFEVRQPRGGFDKRHSGAGFGPREAHTVRRSDISNGLSESAEHSAHLSGAARRIRDIRPGGARAIVAKSGH